MIKQIVIFINLDTHLTFNKEQGNTHTYMM